MVTALLVGADGGLGKAFVDGLKAASWTVTAVGRAELDISLRNDVFDRVKASQPDVIINCAAYNQVDAAEDAPRLALDVNAFAALTLGQASL